MQPAEPIVTSFASIKPSGRPMRHLWTLDENDWAVTMLGQGTEWIRWRNEQPTRLRYIIADAIDEQARIRRRAGRPDKAGVLHWIARQIRYGGLPTKRPCRKVARDLQAVKAQLTRRRGMP